MNLIRSIPLALIILIPVVGAIRCTGNQENQPRGQPSIRIVQPLGGETYGAHDSITILVRFRREISSVYILFSADTGRTLEFITPAWRTTAARDDFYHDTYTWVPADDGVLNTDVWIFAVNYDKPDSLVELNSPIRIRD